MIKNYSTSLFFGVLLTLLQFYLKSNFLQKYLLANLLNIQIAVLAINSATLGLILTKVRELSDQNPEYNYDKLLREMLLSFKEMIALMAISLLIGIISESQIIPNGFFKPYVIETILFAAFSYTVYILYDFVHGICVLLGFKNQIHNHK